LLQKAFNQKSSLLQLLHMSLAELVSPLPHLIRCGAPDGHGDLWLGDAADASNTQWRKSANITAAMTVSQHPLQARDGLAGYCLYRATR